MRVLKTVCPEGPWFFHFLSFWCQSIEKWVYFDCRGFWAYLQTKNTEFFMPFDLLSTCGLLTTYTKHTQTKGKQHVSLFANSEKGWWVQPVSVLRVHVAHACHRHGEVCVSDAPNVFHLLTHGACVFFCLLRFWGHEEGGTLPCHTSPVFIHRQTVAFSDL